MTNMEPNKGEIVMYQPDETIRLEVRMDGETVWLNQAQMAELFGTKRQAITKHLQNIYDCAELKRDTTSSILELVRKEGIRTVKRKSRCHPWRAFSTTARSLMPTPTSSASSSRPNTPSCSSTTTLMRIHL